MRIYVVYRESTSENLAAFASLAGALNFIKEHDHGEPDLFIDDLPLTN